MLQIMRNLSKSWVSKALMLLLIVSFGIWGIGDMFRGNAMQATVAKVGKIAISRQMLESEFQKSLPEARRIFGPDLSAPKARMLGVLDRTLSIMIENLSFDQEVQRLGINVSDKTILDGIASQPQLRDKDGRFKTELWHEALAKGGFSERSFIDMERKSEARRMLLESLVNEVKPPEIMIDSLYEAQGAKRILEVMTVDNASMTDLPAPDNAALEEFYKNHSDLFMMPEYRAITIARLSTNDVTKDIHVTDEDMKKAYDERAADFEHPEQRDLVQVVLQDEDKAKAFAVAAKAKGDLATAAKAEGLKSINLNRVDEKSILPELYTTVFALANNQVSEPVKSDLGWHVLQLKKIYPSGKLSFEETKPTLRETLQNEKAADTAARMVNQLDDSLAASHPLEDIADTLKLRLIKIPELDVNGKLSDGKNPAELPDNKDILKEAFAQAGGETSQVLDDRNGNYYVVRTDEVMPAHVEPFDKVKDRVVMAWKQDKQAERAAEEANKIADELREGKKALAFASMKGVDVHLSKPISLLGDIDKDIPLTAFTQILDMKKGDVITIPAAGKQMVLRLADIVSVDPTKPGPERQKVVKEIDEKLPYETIEEYSNFLHTRFPIKINQELLDTLKKQGT